MTLAVGATGNRGSRGHARVFAWNSRFNSGAGTWVKRGDDFDGERAGDQLGISVSLSADGTTLAVGAWKNDGAGDDAGHARVFAWVSAEDPEKPYKKEWVKLGDDIDGEAAYDESGYSVSLSADGTALAVGAPEYDDGGSWNVNKGHARLFAWDSVDETWVQRGDDFVGDAADDWSGYSVSLSADGTTLAVGAINNDGAGSNAGHTRVYWNSALAGGDADAFTSATTTTFGFAGDDGPHGDGPDCSTKRGRDSESWRRKDAPTKTCEWVKKKPAKRCRKKGATGTRALTECVRACASCPSEGACADDAAWSHINKKNKKLDCVSVARNPGRRCALPGAAAACKQTCGGC